MVAQTRSVAVLLVLRGTAVAEVDPAGTVADAAAVVERPGILLAAGQTRLAVEPLDLLN